MSQQTNIEAIYPLSPMQQGLLFHTLYAPESQAYFEQLSCTLAGELDIPAFRDAWLQVMARHPILRTLFSWGGPDKPVQVVRAQVPLPWEEHDWRGCKPHADAAQFAELLRTDQAKGFDLATAPLMRLILVQLAGGGYGFVWSFHHLLLDGWSVPIVLGEVFACYEQLRRGESINRPLPRAYKDYILWLQQQDLERAKGFWRELLQGFSAPTPLGIDRLPGSALASNQPGEQYAEQQLQLPEATTAALQQLARSQHLTLNTLVQGAWALMLSRYSGEHDIVFGATVAGRPPALVGVESMVGLFINTLPVRIQVPGQARLVPWLHQIQAQHAERQHYEYSPLLQVQHWSDVPRGQSLFESVLVFENYPVDESFKQPVGELQISGANFHERTHYPLTLLVSQSSSLLLRVMYAQQRFDAAMMRRMLEHLQCTLESMAANPGQQLASVGWLSDSERQQVLYTWNNTAVDHPRESCLHQFIEAQARRTPTATAVVFKNQRLTYRELEQRANQLAHYLIQLGVGPEVCVGVAMERSLELVIALLGILKAGGAYVPLDPGYPRERLANMVEDAHIAIVLTHAQVAEITSVWPCRAICIDRDWRLIAHEPDSTPTRAVSAINAAYVIYTSGSTGAPKGAVNSHRSICNRLLWMQDALRLTPNDRVLQKTPYSFDVSVWEFFWPLLAGACLVVAEPGGHQDSAYLVRAIETYGITTVHFVPSMLQIFLEEPGLARCDSLKRVICSGEALPFDLQQRYFAQLGAKLYNLYGPTEAAVDVTFWHCQRERKLALVPIGSPIDNTQIYILDPYGHPLPIGVAGELYIGGVGVARGYLNRPDLTAERFIPDPFGHSPGERLYRTGDRARYRSDGSIEYLGRLDYQVKIRGFRVEPGEIEALLAQHPHVREAIVVVREAQAGDKQLVGYIVSHHPSAAVAAPLTAHDALLVAELRAYLRERLPEYMVPAVFAVLERLPLTPSGKVNRRALPEPAMTNSAPLAWVAARNGLEQRLADIWAEVLGVEQIGIDDHFFDLGGDSFKAIRVVRRFGQDLRVVDLFTYPTIRALAEHLTQPAVSDDGILHQLTPPQASTALTLVCIPYGGGSAVTYQPLARQLPAGYTLYAVALPGHDIGRPDEALLPLGQLARTCADEILRRTVGPLVLYGQCVGVALTVEIARLLEREGRVIHAIMLGGSFPFPQKRFIGLSLGRVLGQLRSDQQTLEFLRSLGGFEELTDAAELKFVMRSFKHDVRAAEDYFTELYHSGLATRLRAPILFIAGDQDPLTRYYHLRYKEWRFFSPSVQLAVIKGGNHYFIKQRAAELAHMLVRHCTPLLATDPSPSATLITSSQTIAARATHEFDSTTYQSDRASPLRWIMAHLMHYRPLLAGFVFSRVAWNALASAIPLLIGLAFSEVLRPAPQPGRILLWALAILAIVLLRGIIGLLGSYTIETLGQRLQHDARDELYRSLLEKSQTFHNRQRVGDIMARAANDVRQLTPMLSPGINLVFDSLIGLMIPLVFISLINPALLLTPVLFIVVFIISLVRYAFQLGPVSGELRAQFGAMNAAVAEIITGIELVKSLAQESSERQRFGGLAHSYRDVFVQQGRVQAQYLAPLLLTIALVVGFLHGLFLIERGQMMVGDLVAYLGLIGLLRGPAFLPIFALALVQLGLIGASRILALINEEAKLDENPAGYQAPMRGEIVFENVSFGYSGSPVLKQISFRAQPGETIAIVGQTGAGKSTLTKLINRTYDADDGHVLVDGVDVCAWSLDGLRSQVATIEQDVFLFSRSIADNIAFGIGQPVDQAVITQAAQQAQAHTFITSFKDGYDTLIGERGTTLSGGQRQRIAIARALLTNPRILILDDSTSAVDSATEDAIQQAIQAVSRGRTTLLITHRLAQIERADRVLLLQQGQLVDQGSHTELMNRCELYQRMFAHYQADEYEQSPAHELQAA